MFTNTFKNILIVKNTTPSLGRTNDYQMAGIQFFTIMDCPAPTYGFYISLMSLCYIKDIKEETQKKVLFFFFKSLTDIIQSSTKVWVAKESGPEG